MNSNDDDYRHHVVIDLLDASDDDDEDDTDAVLESIPVPDWERRRTNQSDAPSAPTTSTHHVRANGGEPQRKTCPEKMAESDKSRHPDPTTASRMNSKPNHTSPNRKTTKEFAKWCFSKKKKRFGGGSAKRSSARAASGGGDFQCLNCNQLFASRRLCRGHYREKHLGLLSASKDFFKLPPEHESRIWRVGDPLPPPIPSSDQVQPDPESAADDAKRSSDSNFLCDPCRRLFAKADECRHHYRLVHLKIAPDSEEMLLPLAVDHERKIIEMLSRRSRPTPAQRQAEVAARSVKLSAAGAVDCELPIPAKKSDQPSGPSKPNPAKKAPTEALPIPAVRKEIKSKSLSNAEALASHSAAPAQSHPPVSAKKSDQSSNPDGPTKPTKRPNPAMKAPTEALPAKRKAIKKSFFGTQASHSGGTIKSHHPESTKKAKKSVSKTGIMAVAEATKRIVPDSAPSGECFDIANHLQLATMKNDKLAAFCFSHFLTAPNGVRKLRIDQMVRVDGLQKAFDALCEDVLTSPSGKQ